MSEPTNEFAKAMQELVKLASSGVDAARELGAFIAKVDGGTFEELGGIVNDSVRFLRWRRRIIIFERAKEFLDAKGIGEYRQVPLNILAPIVEEGSSIADKDLQDVWAAMLANAADSSSQVEMRRAYASILADCTYFDVKILSDVYIATGGGVGVTICSEFLPDRVVLHAKDVVRQTLPSLEVRRSLWNLLRLGTIASNSFADGESQMNNVSMTSLGLGLAEACIFQ